MWRVGTLRFLWGYFTPTPPYLCGTLIKELLCVTLSNSQPCASTLRGCYTLALPYFIIKERRRVRAEPHFGALLYKSLGCGEDIPAGVQGRRPCGAHFASMVSRHFTKNCVAFSS